ncbi:uncharacterized protein V1510DRAFT_414694 [Dipodascopsis tothii]|uniref:uncharacterized protein n=1 Tax=Dipodascopsis tothii TaxID=44089 RepID=UPI0034CD095D
MSSPESAFSSLFKEIDGLKEHFITRLSKAVSIPSVSSDLTLRPKVVEMAHFLKSELTALGAAVELRELGPQPDAPDTQLPPIVLARYGVDTSKRTILVYGHYDVQPALIEDGWATEPFELVQKDDKMYGRGSTDDKGPVMGWINSIEAHQKAGIEFPVNLIMCFEGMEEYGSEGLDDLIFAEKDKFFKDADAVCISDNYWLGTTKPVLTYGLRGCSYYSVTVEGPAADLHSGVFGGMVSEPMIDLVHILSGLVSPDGKILVPGLMDLVAPVTEEESKTYDTIEYEMNDLYAATGAKTNLHDDVKRTLMARWRYPTLSLHGVEGAFSAPGAKTVIPAKVTGKFSIRTVPDMQPHDVDELVFAHVNDLFTKLGSKNKMEIKLLHDGKWWLSSPSHWNFEAAKKATKTVWGVDPDLTREGGSIPVTLSFEQATGKNVLLLPVGRGDDGAHSINEKLDISNYIEGVKTLSAYLHYVAVEKME